MSRRLSSRIGRVSIEIFTASLLLSGCAGLRLHDASKATVTTGIKEKYTQADVIGVIEVEKKNLDNLLAEELKVVRDNQRLQVDFALLSIAANNTPMAETYTEEAMQRLQQLGYQGGFKQAREIRMADVDLTVGSSLLQANADSIKSLVGKAPPPCQRNQTLPPMLEFPSSLSQRDRSRAEFFYKLYREDCGNLQNQPEQQPGGQTKTALEEWRAAEADIQAINQSIEGAQKHVADKQAAYDQAVKELDKAKGSGDELEQELKSKAASLLKALESAKVIENVVASEETAKKRLDAITTILTAAAGGEIDTADEDIKKAATIAQNIPSLADDIKELLATAKAPSVNNLLIEMRHQVLLLEYMKQLKTLAQQRVDILRTKYAALKKEAGHWLKFGDAMCSYAVLSAGQAFPGEACNNFSVSNGTCTLGSAQISNCVLGKPWNENIHTPPNKAATRELYKALAAYLRALAVQATPAEQDFRLIDVWHQETLASRQSAIQSWDNLVAVPINQLDAYYQAGLKPAEIADLIVKALGFTAITIGVSQ